MNRLHAYGWIRSTRRRQRGQSLAEFALVAPIFFLLLFSVIQLGLIFAAQNGLVDGVRNAARRAATYRINDLSFDPSVWGSICTTISAELDARLAELIPGFSTANRTRTIAYEWEQNPENDEYLLTSHISVTYDNPLYVPLIGWFLDSTDGSSDGFLSLSASEKMRVENPALEYASQPADQACP